MAGEWIKVEITTPDKPELMKAARILGVDRDLVFGKLVRLWGWFDKNSVDGRVDGVVSTDVDRLVDMDGFCEALKSVGWLEYDDDAEIVTLPNFDVHNGETAKQRASRNKRQAKWRENVDGGVDKGASTKASTREEKRREEVHTHTTREGEPGSLDSNRETPSRDGDSLPGNDDSNPIKDSLVQNPNDFAEIPSEREWMDACAMGGVPVAFAREMWLRYDGKREFWTSRPWRKNVPMVKEWFEKDRDVKGTRNHDGTLKAKEVARAPQKPRTNEPDRNSDCQDWEIRSAKLRKRMIEKGQIAGSEPDEIERMNEVLRKAGLETYDGTGSHRPIKAKAN